MINSHWLNIRDVVHYKKEVLFITEDGINIEKGDSYYWVYELETLGNTKPFKSKKVDKATTNPESFSFAKQCKVHNFSTKKAAELYILENKPCLNLKEVKIINQCNNKGYFTDTALERLVKSKLEKDV